MRVFHSLLTTPHARVARSRRKKSVPFVGRSCSSLNFSTATSSGRQSSISWSRSSDASTHHCLATRPLSTSGCSLQVCITDASHSGVMRNEESV